MNGVAAQGGKKKKVPFAGPDLHGQKDPAIYVGDFAGMGHWDPHGFPRPAWRDLFDRMGFRCTLRIMCRGNLVFKVSSVAPVRIPKFNRPLQIAFPCIGMDAPGFFLREVGIQYVRA